MGIQRKYIFQFSSVKILVSKALPWKYFHISPESVVFRYCSANGKDYFSMGPCNNYFLNKIQKCFWKVILNQQTILYQSFQIFLRLPRETVLQNAPNTCIVEIFRREILQSKLDLSYSIWMLIQVRTTHYTHVNRCLENKEIFWFLSKTSTPVLCTSGIVLRPQRLEMMMYYHQ